MAFTGAPVRNYRDFLEVDDRWGNLHWLLQHNGGVFLPPWGKVEQWLLSVQHTEADVDLLVANFAKLTEIAGAIRGDGRGQRLRVLVRRLPGVRPRLVLGVLHRDVVGEGRR